MARMRSYKNKMRKQNGLTRACSKQPKLCKKILRETDPTIVIKKETDPTIVYMPPKRDRVQKRRKEKTDQAMHH
jgi:hypothetical protein